MFKLHIFLANLMLMVMSVNASVLTDTILINEIKEHRDCKKIISDWVDSYKSNCQSKNLEVVKHYLSYWGGGNEKLEIYKSEFVAKMGSLMMSKSFVSEIDHVSIQPHYRKPNIFGLNFHQSVKTDHYRDSGWFFMLWDFNDPDKPQIHVQTWQPDQAVAKDGVFTLDDFFIP